MSDNGYPWWVALLGVAAIAGVILPFAVALGTGEWRWLIISVICFIILTAG